MKEEICKKIILTRLLRRSGLLSICQLNNIVLQLGAKGRPPRATDRSTQNLLTA